MLRPFCQTSKMLILLVCRKQTTGFLRRMQTIPMPKTLWIVASVFKKEVAELEEKRSWRASKKKLEKQTFPSLEHPHWTLSFYDALADNESARELLGDETLRKMARELVETVRKNVTIDWTLRDSVQAKLRVLVKRMLKRYGYPPDKRQKATDTAFRSFDWYDEKRVRKSERTEDRHFSQRRIRQQIPLHASRSRCA